MILFLIFLVIIICIFLIKQPYPKETTFVKRDKKHKRNDRSRIQDLTFTREDKSIIFSNFHNKCFNCGSKKNLTIDHHYPLEKGYSLKNSDGTYNAVLLCSKCNMKKSNKMPEKFYSPEQLQFLQTNYGLKKMEKEVYDIYKLKDENALIEFNYLGKIYKGEVQEILQEDKNLLGVRKKIYIEIDVFGEKIAFPLAGVKNIKKLNKV